MSVVSCDLNERQLVPQTRIWPKYNFKGDAPPSASSAGHIFTGREAFMFICVLCGSQFAGFLHLSSVLFVPRCLHAFCLYQQHTGAGAEILLSSIKSVSRK